MISESLRSYARLLNIKTSIIENDKVPKFANDSQKLIVDVSGDLCQSFKSIEASKKLYGNNNVNNPFIKWRDSKDPYGDCC